MQIGMIGLGRMGMNMARRLIQAKHEVVVSNRTLDKVEAMVKEGAVGVKSPAELVQKLRAPRVVWLMLPTGPVLEEHIETLGKELGKGDVLIDGGNSFFKDDLRHHETLKSKGIHFIDAGVSGGIWGLKNGYCTMVGGEEEIFKKIEPLLRDLAPKEGYLYCGGPGAGHFVKMIHNGIEYGMMQAYAEGFEILKASPYKMDLSKVAHLWNQGSVVRSWLLELAAEAFKENPELKDLSGYVEDSGEGRWTVQEALELGVAAPIISLSLYQRFLSRQKDAFSNRVVSALRNKFGGHELFKGRDVEKNSGAGAGEVKPAKAEKGTKPSRY